MPRRLLPLSLLLLAAACSGSGDLKFPAGFLFGTAIAGFQAEMGCPTLPAAQCEDRHSDWYAFVTTPELVADPSLAISGDPPSSGPGFFELYPQDLDRAKNELRSNALRTSIEWSRVFPESTVGVEGYDALKARASAPALAWYHALFAAMKARGLTPFVTLNHYTLPDWIHDAPGCHKDLAHCTRRGWLDGDVTVREIAKYAGFVAKEFGGEVDLWATLNEPFTAVVVAGYLLPGAERSNPPGVSIKWAEAKAATRNLIEAHNRMADAVRANDKVDADGDGRPARVGLVYNLQAVAAKNPQRVEDQQAARNLSYLMNELFLDGALNGDLDPKLDGVREHHEELAGRTDFVGINYYDRVTCEGLAKPLFPADAPLMTFNPFTLQLDNVADGISEVFTLAKSYNVPLFVTETGLLDATDTGAAARWIAETLTRTRRALDAGVRLEGWFYWTLMDNYEWNHGMSMRLGLYAVDKADPAKARVPRAKAVEAFRRIAGAGAVPEDLVTGG